MSKINKMVKDNIIRLNQFVPVVRRVHGPEHPEFHDVAKIYNEIESKISDNEDDLSKEFKSLREITSNYQIPDGVCESYEAVYEMLAELDKHFNKA